MNDDDELTGRDLVVRMVWLILVITFAIGLWMVWSLIMFVWVVLTGLYEPFPGEVKWVVVSITVNYCWLELTADSI